MITDCVLQIMLMKIPTLDIVWLILFPLESIEEKGICLRELNLFCTQETDLIWMEAKVQPLKPNIYWGDARQENCQKEKFTVYDWRGKD